MTVLTEHPLQALLRQADFSSRIAWGTSLGAFDIKYYPRMSNKGQVLVDFVVEFTLGGLVIMSIQGEISEQREKTP